MYLVPGRARRKSMLKARHLVIAAFLAAGFLCCGIFAPSQGFLNGEDYAAPPDWAPAHGWREKHHHEYDEDDDYREREHDYRYRQREVIEVAPLPLIASH